MEERGDASDGLTGRRYAQVCAYHGERIGIPIVHIDTVTEEFNYKEPVYRDTVRTQ
jgi:hypothetical protein